jgi:N-hydroxyarylamine O-acetyltransferase
MIPTDEALESLDLPVAEPGLGYLQALFARFNERVPFETASKIVRNAGVSDPAGKPRRPELFWADHLDSGAGGTCFARVAAFDALLSSLGFTARLALGRVQSDFDHASLLVTLDGEEWICDVGFPLPVLLRSRGGETETPLGAVRVTRGGHGWRVELLEGVPEGPRELEIFAAPVPPEEFGMRWRETFRPGSSFLSAVRMRREKEGRTVSFSAGEIRVDDLHSRTRIPLAAPRAPILEEQFGVDRDLFDRAFSITGDPEPELSCAQVTVYLEATGPPRAAFDAIASARGYRGLMEGVARVAKEEPAGRGWRLRLAPPGTGGAEPAEGEIEEEITPDAENLVLRVRRGTRDSFYEAIDRGGRTFLVRRLALDGPRLDLLRNDSLRGRFAGSLAVDLLAWARLLGRSKV